MEKEFYVWEVELQEHYSNMDKDDWDKDLTGDYRIVASSYASALKSAKEESLSGSYTDDDGEEFRVDDVCLLSIVQGVRIDIVAS